MEYDWTNVDECCDRIKAHITGDSPFLIGKIGATELNILVHAYSGQLISPDCAVGNQCERAAGMYPVNDPNVIRNFYQLMGNAIENIDGISYWVGGMENLSDKKFVESVWNKNIKEQYILRSLDVVNPNNWTRSLDGKKVLVVSPFAETIRSQYKAREDWDMMGWCPAFDQLHVVRSRYSKAVDKNGFENWNDEFSRMFDEIKSIDFDIALLGCGSFGLPLAGKIKTELNKSAIHMGGCLQNMFGIKGRRWMMRNDYVCFMNEKWIRPFHAEIPSDVENFSPVDGPCYF